MLRHFRFPLFCSVHDSAARLSEAARGKFGRVDPIRNREKQVQWQPDRGHTRLMRAEHVERMIPHVDRALRRNAQLFAGDPKDARVGLPNADLL